MSRNAIVVLIYRHYELLDLIYISKTNFIEINEISLFLWGSITDNYLKSYYNYVHTRLMSQRYTS